MKEARLAQARHRASEELVYRELYRVGTERPDGSRDAAISQRSLAVRTGRDQRTVERSIRGLIDKGSIELVTKARSGRSAVYHVLSYGQILLADRPADTAGGRDV